MNDLTRQQLRALSLAFYEAHADAFDASRVDLPWPGWERVRAALTTAGEPTAPQRIRVLDVGCGNGRFALDLHSAGLTFEYEGLDANARLLEAGRARWAATEPTTAARSGSGFESEIPPPSIRFTQHDFLADSTPGALLPAGPYELIVLMGVLHHVPSPEWRLSLLRACAERLAPGGLLAFATWQFAEQTRFAKRRADWTEIGELKGQPLDPNELDPGDHLLRFGGDATQPPRYCHQVSEAEFDGWPEALGLRSVDRFLADGAQGDLNRYWLLRMP